MMSKATTTSLQSVVDYSSFNIKAAAAAHSFIYRDSSSSFSAQTVNRINIYIVPKIPRTTHSGPLIWIISKLPRFKLAARRCKIIVLFIMLDAPRDLARFARLSELLLGTADGTRPRVKWNSTVDRTQYLPV
jgi:hypothetical protein